MAIFTAIGTAIAGALFAGSALAANLIAGALAFGTKLAASYLNRPKKRAYGAVQGETQYGGAVPASTLYGVGKTAGHRLFYAKWGRGNRWNAEVFRLAHGWCDGLEPYVYFYGEKYALIPKTPYANEVARYEIEQFGDNLTFRFFDGRPGQQADARLIERTAGQTQAWKATSTCSGMCYVVAERAYDERFSKGRPSFEFVLRGLRLYDPRKDSTIGGGSGSQRRNDPATWTFSKNPVVQRLNYQLGLRGVVSNRTIIGEGKTLGQLDLSSYFASMNVADTQVNGRATYEAGLFVTSDDDHTEVLREFDDAVAGYGMNRRGLSGIIAGAPQIPVLTLTADDIDAGRETTRQNRKSAFDLFNYLSGQFTSPEAQWNPESLKPIYVNADVAADGRPRQTSNDFLQVSNPDIAQYLLGIRYRQNRKGGSAQVPVSRRVGLAVQEGEWIIWEGKTWLVTNWAADDQFRFTLTLGETGADIYASGAIIPGPIVVPVLPGTSDFQSELVNYQLQGAIIQTETGAKRPALRPTFNVPDDATITHVDWEYRPVNDPSIVLKKTTPMPANAEVLADGVISLSDYDVRYRLRAKPARQIPWTNWQTIKAPDARLSGADILLDALSIPPEIYAIGKANWQAMQDAFVELERLNGLVAGQDAGNFRDKQTLRQELQSSAGGLDAKFTDLWTVATSDTAALASRVQVAETALPGKASTTSVQQLESRTTATEGGLTSQGNAITAINAALPGKANVTALTALEGRVTSTENSITAQGTSISGIQTTLNTKANASAVTALTTRVTDVEGQVSSQADAITGVQATANSATASALLRMQAVAGPSGWSRIALQTKVNASDTFGAAGLFMDSRTSGANRIVLQADQITFINNVGAVVALFGGGGAYLNTAYIKNLTSDSLTLGGIEYTSLAPKAVTNKDRLTGTVTNTGNDSAWRTITTITIANPDAQPVFLEYTLNLSGSKPAGGGQTGELNVRLRRVTGSTVLTPDFSRTYSAGASGADSLTGFRVDDTAPAGNVVYALEYLCNSMGSNTQSGLVKMVWQNR